MIDEKLSMLEIEEVFNKILADNIRTNELTILGDLDLSEKEYSILLSKLRGYFCNTNNSLKDLIEMFGTSIMVAAVFTTKYRYNRNFWGAFSDELGREFNPVNQRLIGTTCLNMLERFGFKYDDLEIHLPYLDPLCYEAGVPTAGCLDGLFDAVKNDEMHTFDPQQIIEDLLDERTYGVRKTLKKYLRQFKDDRAIDCVLEIHDAVLSVDQGIHGESWYIRSYEDWMQRETERSSKEKNEQQNIIAKPYLVFDNYYGLCLQMPKLFLKQEYVEKPKWTLLCDEDGLEISKVMNVVTDFGHRRIQETKIPVPAANTYRVTLTDSEADDDEDEILAPWEINGIQDGGILLFNAEGRAISPKFLPYPHATLILADEKAKIISMEHSDDNELNYPLFQNGKAKIICVTPHDYRAKITVVSNEKEITLEARPHVDVTLTGKFLLNTEPMSGLKIFTELPTLKIETDDIEQANSFDIRFGQTSLKPDDIETDEYCQISLVRYQERCFSEYGVYSLRIYKNGLFIKSVDFGYAPYIKTNYNPMISWPTKESMAKTSKIDFDVSDALESNPDLDITLDFERCIVKHSNEKYTAECMPGMGMLKGTLHIENANNRKGKISFTFSLPLQPFNYSIVTSSSNTLEKKTNSTAYRLPLEDINNETYWLLLDCYGDYANKDYVLKLHTVDGYIQIEKLKRNSATTLSCNLSAFSSTLNNCPLPACLELFTTEDMEKCLPIATISKESQLSGRPNHAYHNGKSQFYFNQKADKQKNIILKSFRRPENKIELPYEESIEKTTPKGAVLRVFTLDELQPGFYSVSSGETADDPFGFEEEFGVQISNGNDTMYVSKDTKRTSFQSFSDWLDSLMTDIMVAGQLKHISEKITYQAVEKGDLNRWRDADLSDEDLTNLVALAWLRSDKQCSKEKLWQISRCMSEISCMVLNSETRAMLAKHVLKMACPPNIINSCIHSYDLLLIKTNDEDADMLAEQLAANSEELSLIMLMGKNAPMREVFNERGLRTLGKEALMKMMTVPDADDPLSVSDGQRQFLREIKGSKVLIELPQDLAGKEDWINPLVVYDKQRVYLDLDKMPDEGISFDGIRFAEQCVNWFRLRSNKDKKTRDSQLLDEEFENVMIRAIMEDCKALMTFYKAAGNDPTTRTIQKRYNHGICKRYTKEATASLSAGIPLRFFYVQAVAAFLALMPERYKPNSEALHTAQHFLSMASRVASRMVRRDLLMAATFYYLIGKEEELCQ